MESIIAHKDEIASARGSEFRYILFLGFLAAVPPLATDMYLAAMPTIARQWSVSENQIGKSLVLWFLAFSISLLACGPIADKKGRRPVLLVGLSIFAIATFLCALSDSLTELIFFRILQGIGASAPSAMCMAICRDKYDGQRRKNILAYIAIVLCFAPMIAPTIGAFLLRYWGWRSIFYLQGGLALIMILFSIPYKETLAEPLTYGWFRSFARYRVLFRNGGFMLCNSVMGLIPGPFYGFLALSSIAYITIFGRTEFEFAIFFACNALVSIAGSFSCTRLNRVVSDNLLITICLLGCVCGGLGLILFGSSHYLFFAVFVSVITYFSGMSRPLSNHLILGQINTDIGSASSFIVFYQIFIGQLCMRYVILDWSDPIYSFGWLALAVPLLVLVMWLIFVNKYDNSSNR